ncbi:MAG: carboxyl transferase domain-containing protein, partial [Nitrosopumilaceae archaeon]
MHSDKIDEFLKKNKIAEQAGGQDKILAQHEKGKLTGRERIDLLLDEGSFVELDKLTTHHYHEYEMQ